MDVNNVINTYSMATLWNNINPYGTSNLSSVPLINNIDSSIQENYTQSNFFGQNINSELQDIYQQVEPTNGIPLTYDNSGNLTIPTNTNLSSNGLSPEYSNILSLIQSGESSTDLTNSNILYQYYTIEDGTYQSTISGILSSNPYNMYSNINSLFDNQTQSAGSYLDSMV